ncbi:MAG: SCO1664 family protein [Candidatus Nanopelagicales bacterium]
MRLPELATGDLHVLGRLADASNLALLAQVSTDAGAIRCIYKPVRGERPLWDFPDTALAAREVLCAQVAAGLGWDLIPATHWRTDGPLGPGMCQEWIEAVDDPPVGLFDRDQVPDRWRQIAEGRTSEGGIVVLAHEDSPALQRLAVLDALVNNADRKGGHVLRRADGGLAGIDHGVSFHVENKLRTVLWGWAGERLPDALAEELDAGATSFRSLVTQWGGATDGGAADGGAADGAVAAAAGRGHLSTDEVAAAHARLDELLRTRRFPMPGAQWPTLPWPPM